MKHKEKTKHIASVVMKISKEQNVIADVQASISTIIFLLKDNAQLRGFLQSKRFSMDQKGELIHSVFKDLVHPIVRELIVLYADDNPIIFLRNFSFILIHW